MLTISVAVCNPNIPIFRNFLTSLKKYTPEMSQLIIADNGEKDEWETVLEEVFTNGHLIDIQIIKHEKNIGFGEAHNQNVALATGEYVAILNDDIEFFETWSTPMIEAFTDGVGQVGMRTDVCNKLTAKAEGYGEDTEEPEYIEASCMMMRTFIAKVYGPFDSAYKFAYFEDTDLSLRLRKDKYILKNVNLRWRHHRAVTSSKVKVDIKGYHIKNEMTFRTRWIGYLHTKRFTDVVLLKRQGSLGDVFLLGPVVDALHKKHPDTIFGLMSQSNDLLIEHPHITGTAQYGKPTRCSKIIDFDFSYEKDFRKHIIDTYAEVANVTVTKKHGTVYLNDADQQYVDRIMKDDKDYILFEMSDTWWEKQWSMDKYEKLLRKLQKDGNRVYAIGVSQHYFGAMGFDRNYMNVFKPMQTAAMMKRAKLFVGHEGLLGHFAQALNIPHIILYGCTSPEFVSDTSLETWRGVVSPVGCQGCRHVFCAGVMVQCPRNAECMKQITVDMVYDSYRSLIDENILCAG